MLVEFFIPGLPVAKARARFVRRGFIRRDGSMGFAHPDPKTQAAERGIAFFAAEAMRGRPPFDVPLEVRIVAIWPAPKTRSRAEREAPWSAFRASRPDLDNLVKAATDAMNGIVFRDDALVAAVHAAKIYGAPTGLRVTVATLGRHSWPCLKQPVAEAAELFPAVPVTAGGRPSGPQRPDGTFDPRAAEAAA